MRAQRQRHSFVRAVVAAAAIASIAAPAAVAPQSAVAAHTPEPASVNLAGSLQSEATAGACGDWDPSCVGSRFTSQGNNVFLFQSVADIPAGNWEYKVGLGGWDINFGAGGVQGGPNIGLNLSAPRTVRFYYDHKTHYIADNARNTIYTVPGSFNSELGCSGDWQPECLRTLMSDNDGDGIYTFETDAIPPGNYEFKIATNESWSNPNFGQGGGPNNVALNVPGPGTVTFSFNANTSVPSASFRSALPGPDNNVEWDGIKHDSRDGLYRTPGGAVTQGTDVKIRLRAFHNDLTAATLRVYDLNVNGQRLLPMSVVASDVSCYDTSITGKTCDFWEATVTQATPNNFWYRFFVTDGTDTDYYGDDTAALDGGVGRMTDDPVDQSYALMFYDPAFTSPAWAKNAVIYQIFPDRFRNGDKKNDPKTGDVRYDDPVIALPWGTLPEGYCRNYADAAANCPWRFDDTPPSWSPAKEGPRGRDYMGGDLRGVRQRLSYLQKLGVNTIYFNPIFAAKSNHRYDTAEYYKIDPALGDQKEFEALVREAKSFGIRIVLDGVFNHMSSDSPLFDRYNHYPQVGACEAGDSPWRNWFNFRAPSGAEVGVCAPSTPGGNDTQYTGWFGFDSIPEIKKTNPAVQEYFLTNSDSVSRFWLNLGIAGWRQDVMGDASFPNGYWESFREVAKTGHPDSIIIGELWQKDSTLLRFLRGDRADTAMNYRLRDAVLGLLTPGPFDSKGFGDSGRIIKPSEFANRVLSIREDYPDAAYYALMNLMGSHDTERVLWTLTPGQETRAEKEFNAANLAAGKRRQQLAAFIQYTMPGAPTVYYGDEVGVTGDDDPDDRRTYPWADVGGSPDNAQLKFYTDLAKNRAFYKSLTQGDLRVLLADDAAETVAYSRKAGDEASVIAINRSAQTRTIAIPVQGYLPDGTGLQVVYCVANRNIALWHTVQNGVLSVTLEPNSAAWLTTYQADLTPPAAPSNLRLTDEGSTQVSLAWDAVSGAAGYNLYRSPVSGGGWVKVNQSPISNPQYTDTGLTNAKTYYYAVKAVDDKGNESAASNEIAALPHYKIGWANLQWPPTIDHTISTVNRTPDIYGQVWIDGVTNQPGATPGLKAQVGYGPAGSSPTGADWTWTDATFNTNAGNNDEWKASLLPEAMGTFNYVYRYSTTNGRDWLYADLSGPLAPNALPANPGVLNVISSGDTTAPATPANLRVVTASPAGIELAWDAVTGDPTLYGYEVLRSSTAGGPYAQIARVTAASYTDTSVASGATYYYVVRALDQSFNRSGNTAEAQATAQLRTVTLTINVTVPATTDATGRSVYIAGFLDRLDGGLPQWNPGGVVMTRVSPTQWTITLTGRETTQIEYKFALGSWDYVEKDGGCGETANRQLTLTYGATGAQTANEIVPNWRNVAPCGN
jgi:glycosidase